MTRAEEPADVPGIRAVNLAVFPGDEEADLVDALRADAAAWIAPLSMVALSDDGVVAGYALLTRCHIGETPALCLAPCAVMPSHQRQGAGSAAINAALSAAAGLDERFVVVLGHPEYYPRFGFTPAREANIGVTFEHNPDALMFLNLAPGEPAPSGVVTYAAPFGI